MAYSGYEILGFVKGESSREELLERIADPSTQSQKFY